MTSPITLPLPAAWHVPPAAPAVLWGLGVVLAILTLGALAAALLPVVRPGKDYTNLRQLSLIHI